MRLDSMAAQRGARAALRVIEFAVAVGAGLIASYLILQGRW